MPGFRNYFYGQSPQWSPEVQYGVLEDIETGKGIKQGNHYALIPFCVYGYIPRYKDQFGISDEPELKEVYPFVQLVRDDGSSIDKEIDLPNFLDPRRLVKAALNHVRSKYNHYNWVPDKKKIYNICWQKVENYLRENPGEVEMHPHDPNYND